MATSTQEREGTGRGKGQEGGRGKGKTRKKQEEARDSTFFNIFTYGLQENRSRDLQAVQIILLILREILS